MFHWNAVSWTHWVSSLEESRGYYQCIGKVRKYNFNWFIIARPCERGFSSSSGLSYASRSLLNAYLQSNRKGMLVTRILIPVQMCITSHILNNVAVKRMSRSNCTVSLVRFSVSLATSPFSCLLSGMLSLNFRRIP